MGTIMQNDLDLFVQGKLNEAIQTATENVKSKQEDIVVRSRLIEYLCVAGLYDRADRQLEVIASQDPKTTVRVMELRQIMRAAKIREDVLKIGRLPEFISAPPEHINCRLRALVAIRENNLSESAEWLTKAEEFRPSLNGFVEETKFDEFRDLDDFFGGLLEVYTSTGKYFWVPMEAIIEANFTSPSRAIDKAWVEVDLTLKDGPSGVVYIPATYPNLQNTDTSERLLCGLETDWIENEFGITRGVGLRCFILGDQSISINELTNLRFE